MIAALHSSRLDGTNYINQAVSDRGKRQRETMEGMLNREVNRMQSGQLCRVPGLKENHVHRDSWTRLNVKPAKNHAGNIFTHTEIVHVFVRVED